MVRRMTSCKRKIPLALLLTAVLAISGCQEEIEPLGPPNIIVILADDMGYGDIEYYNEESKIPTPNLSRQANEGVAFTDAHSRTAVCTPT